MINVSSAGFSQLRNTNLDKYLIFTRICVILNVIQMFLYSFSKLNMTNTVTVSEMGAFAAPINVSNILSRSIIYRRHLCSLEMLLFLYFYLYMR